MRALVLLALVGCGGETDLGIYEGDYLGGIGPGVAPTPCGFDRFCYDSETGDPGSTFSLGTGQVSGSCEGSIAVSDIQPAEALAPDEQRRTARFSFDVRYYNVQIRGTNVRGVLVASPTGKTMFGNVSPTGTTLDDPIHITATAADGSACEADYPYLLNARTQP